MNFAKYATHGTGLATVLRRFDRHPDYIKTINSDGCSKADQAVAAINQRAEDVIYKEIVALNILLDWCDEDREIPRK